MSLTIQAFYDNRHYNILRVAAVSPKVFPSEADKNAEQILIYLVLMHEQGVKLVVFPELNLRGYYLQDIHHDDTIYEDCQRNIQRILEVTKDLDIMFAFGDIVRIDGLNFNGMYVCHKGKVLCIFIKSYLPNNNEFTEYRWIRPASQLPRNMIFRFGQEIPVGNDIVLRHKTNEFLVIGGDICEDRWVQLPPRSIHAAHGALICIGGHASNFELGKLDWKKLLAKRSGIDIAAFIDAAAGPSESTTSVVFESYSTIAQGGTIHEESPNFAHNGCHIVSDLDLGIVAADRRRLNSWSENATHIRNTNPVRTFYFDGLSTKGNEDQYQTLLRKVDPLPLVPKTDQERHLAFMARVMGLRKRLSALPEGERQMIVDLSGGLDSLIALLVDLEVVDSFGPELGLTRQNIIAVTMPGKGTHDDSYYDARKLAELTGTTFLDLSVVELSDMLFKTLGHPNLADDMTQEQRLKSLFENGQVWLRKNISLCVCILYKGIDTGSSSASEINIGWFTLFGDGSSHYGNNAGMGKSASPYEVQWQARTKFVNLPELAALLVKISNKPPSPENLPLEDGQVTQLSHKFNGPDIPRDFFTYWIERYRMKASKVLRLAIHAFSMPNLDKFDIPAEEVIKILYAPQQLYIWLRNFIWRYYTQRYKINTQSTDSVKIGSVAPSAHDVSKMPSDIPPIAWLQELDRNVPDEWKALTAA